MKILVILSSIFMSMHAFATTICTSGDVVLEISESNQHYRISVDRHNRNNYSAVYKSITQSGSIKSGDIYLEKVVDHSTWQDMPANLKLRYQISIMPQPSRQLLGFPDIDEADFSPYSCVKKF